MEAKKDIGKAIREKLDGLDRQPSDAMWGAISADLDQQKKKRKFFPFFWMYIISCTVVGVTAVALVLSNLEGSHNIISAQPNGASGSHNVTETHNASGKDVNNSVTSSANKNNSSETASDSEKNSQSKASENKSTSVKTDLVNKNNTKASHKNTTSENKTQSATAAKKQNPSNKNSRRNNNNTQVATVNVEKGKAAKAKKVSGNSVIGTGVRAGSGNTPKNREYSNTSNENAIAKNNSTTQTQNSKIDSWQPVTVNSENSTVNNKNSSSIIETKKIGSINIENATDTTKVVPDSLKVAAPTEEAKKEDENKKDSIPPVPYKKFSVYAYGGPSYFSFPNRTVVTDSTTSDINTKSTTRFGVLFGYNLNRKLSIRTGVSFYKLKQSANNIKLNYRMETTPTGGAEIMPPPDFTWIDYQQPFGTNSNLIINTLGENYEAIINIDRELSYVEIPLEVNYNLFDRRFGINVFGGGSMLLLNKNEVTAYNEKGKMYLGEWNAAEKTSFTATLGLGLYYKISPSFQVNAEPVFNYYFNSYSDSKPYSFSLRIGLQYNFDF